MIRFTILLFVWMSTLFSYTKIEDHSELVSLHPSLSERKTAKIILDNGMQVYLISDTNFQKSAAALSVQVGSWHDPKEYPGMAHFLEHMLFHGTKAYPDETEYSHFISDHGGIYNASTGDAQTTYSFCINHDYFIEALDRFSHFFIDPLLSPSCISRELHAVDQEYSLHLENDVSRAFHIMKEIANPHHPFSHFSIGTAQTLSSIPLEALQQWFYNYYDPKIMNLVICSNLPIDVLMEKTCEKFEKILPKKASISQNTAPFSSKKQKNNYIFIKPFENHKCLWLLWEINDYKILHDPTHSLELIQYYLQSPHENGLEQILKSQHLIHSMSVVESLWDKYHKPFVISLDLTDYGLQEYNSVIELVFSYLNLLKKNTSFQELYEENRRMKKITYEYQPQSETYDFVTQHAMNLAYENFDTYPLKTLLPQKYNLRNITYALHSLSPDNVQIYVFGDPKKTHVLPTQKEKWLGGEYAFVKINPQIKTKWKKAASELLTLPNKNKYMPSDNIFTKPTIPLTDPIQLVDNEHGCLIFANDSSSVLPEICWFFHLKSPLFDQSPHSLAQMELLLALIEKKLQPLIMQGKQANLAVDISIFPYSLEGSIKGYSEKAQVFFADILENMRSITITKQDFDDIFQLVKRSFENQQKNLNYQQAFDNFSTFVNHLPSLHTQRKALEDISYEKFSQFYQKVFDQTYIEVTFCGDISQEEAKEVFQKSIDFLSKNPFLPKDHPSKTAFSFPENTGPFEVLQQNNLQGNAILLVIDEGPYSKKRQAAHEILSQSIKQEFFDTLRTKQKTGYIAQNREQNIHSHLYQMFTVQSNSHDVYDLLHRFEIFLEDFVQNIEENIPKERFEQIKNNRILLLKNPPKNMAEYAYLIDILAYEHDKEFGRRQTRVQSYQDLTYEEFIDFCRQVLSQSNKKRLAILYQGILAENQQFIYQPITFESLNSLGKFTTKEENSTDIVHN